MTATITVRAISIDGTDLSDYQLAECHASVSYQESDGCNTVSVQFVGRTLRCDAGMVQQWAESGGHRVDLEWTPRQQQSPRLATSHILSTKAQADVVFWNDSMEDTGDLEMYQRMTRPLPENKGRHFSPNDQLGAMPEEGTIQKSGKYIVESSEESSAGYSGQGVLAHPSNTPLLVACRCPSCGSQLESREPSLVWSTTCRTNGIPLCPDTMSMCATIADHSEQTEGATSAVQLGTDDPLEPCPDIDFVEVAVRQQLLDEMRYREVRNAQLEYQRTRDPRAFQSLLAPFAATGDGKEREKPVWIWNQDMQRFYCEDPKTKRILWCPTSGPFA